MSQTVLLKRTSVIGRTGADTVLNSGEMAMNTTDLRLWAQGDALFEILSEYSSIKKLQDVDSAMTPTTGDVLRYDALGKWTSDNTLTTLTTSKADLAGSSTQDFAVQNLSVTGSIIPTVADTFDLGSVAFPFRDLHLGPQSLYVNGTQLISDNSNTINIHTSPDQHLDLQTSGVGNIGISATGTGNITLGNGAVGGNIELKSTVEILAGKNIISSDGNPISFSQGANFSGNISATAFLEGATPIADKYALVSGNSAQNFSTNNLTVNGSLNIVGSTTTINSTTVQVSDKNIELGYIDGISETDITANGGGITLLGDTTKTILWNNTTTSWDFNQVIKENGTLLSDKYAPISHTHPYDNYGSWNFFASDVQAISSGETVTFVGSGATTITNSGNTITISSTDSAYTLPVASTTLGGVKSGTDITVDVSGNVSVNDNSHTHDSTTISNLDASDVTTGTFATARIPTNISITGNAATATTATNAGNANLLDNLDSTQFLRSDVDDSTSGSITLTGTGRNGLINSQSFMAPLAGFVAYPKGYTGGAGFEFRGDTSQTAYIFDEQNPTYTMLAGTDPGAASMHQLFEWTNSYINLNTLKDASNNWSFEVTGFSLSNSSNSNWKPHVFFHSSGSLVANIKIEGRAGDNLTWVTMYDGACLDFIVPNSYTVISPGVLTGMRFTFTGISNNAYLKMLGITSTTSASYSWNMMKNGGSFFGDISGKSLGLQTWKITQAGVLSGLISATTSDIYFNDTNSRLTEGSQNSLKVVTPSGYLEMGAQNTSWAHFNTDRPGHYFNKMVEAVTSIGVYSSNTYMTATNIYEDGVALSSKFLGITAKAADSDKLDNLDSTQFLRSDISGTLNGNLNVNGSVIVSQDGLGLTVKADSTLGQDSIIEIVGARNTLVSNTAAQLILSNYDTDDSAKFQFGRISAGAENATTHTGQLAISTSNGTALVDAITIDSTQNTSFSSNVTVNGNLTVNGTTTTLNSTTLQVDDKNIELGTVASPTDTTADGGGITLKGTTDKTIIWTNATQTWDFNQGINVTGVATATSFSGDGASITNVNAQTLDSLDSTQFLRSDQSDSFTGNLTMANGDIQFATALSGFTNPNGNSLLRTSTSDGGNASVIGNALGTTYFDSLTDPIVRVNGGANQTIYHSGNLTSNIINSLGIDAQTLDTLDSTQFLRSDVSDTMTGDLSIVGSISIDNNITLNTGTGSTTTVSSTNVSTFDGTIYSSGKFIIQVKDTVTGEYQVSELLVVHDGTTASSTEYGVVLTGVLLAGFNANYNAGTIEIQATATSTNTMNYTVQQNLIKG